MTSWTQERTIQLIEELHARPVLWDVSVPEYKNRNKKRDGLKEVADIFKCDVAEIDKKIKNVKVQFRREHKALCARKKSGSSPKKVAWFGYEMLLFLLPTTESRGSRSTISEKNDDEEESDVQEDDDLTQVDNPIPTPPPGPENEPIPTTGVESNTTPNRIFRIPLPKDNRKRRQAQADEAFTVMRDMKEVVSKRDEFSIYGELVANKLRKFTSSPRSAALAQRSINEILFNLEMEQYPGYDQTNSALHTGHYSANTSAGRYGAGMDSFNSPSNTSASSSPSLLADHVQQFNLPNSSYHSLSSAPSTELYPTTEVQQYAQLNPGQPQ